LLLAHGAEVDSKDMVRHLPVHQMAVLIDVTEFHSQIEHMVIFIY
jgi:hypothetical protein